MVHMLVSALFSMGQKIGTIVPMSTVFEKIISGEWSGRFVWSEETVVAFATIAPTAPGHVLVVPRQPWAKWTEVPSPVRARLFEVAGIIGAVQEEVFEVVRSGMVIAGFEVPHTHLHVIPLRSESDVNLTTAHEASPEDLDEAMTALRSGLIDAGWGDYVPQNIASCD